MKYDAATTFYPRALRGASRDGRPQPTSFFRLNDAGPDDVSPVIGSWRRHQAKGSSLSGRPEREKRIWKRFPSGRFRQIAGKEPEKPGAEASHEATKARRKPSSDPADIPFRQKLGASCRPPAGHLQTLVPSASCLVPSSGGRVPCGCSEPDDFIFIRRNPCSLSANS